jgi:hypothetical protein
MVGEEMCWGCEKRVYAAEQVFAVNHKYVPPPPQSPLLRTELGLVIDGLV